jgi:hypothetical protein
MEARRLPVNEGENVTQTVVKPERNGMGRYTDGRKHAERDSRMCRMLAQHYTYAQVARIEGVSEMTVRRAEKKGLAAIRGVGGKELQAAQFAELQAAKDLAWEIALNPRPKISNTGKVATDKNGDPIPDQSTQLNALEVINKLNSSQSRLMGLDEPRKSISAHAHIDTAQLQAQVLREAQEIQEQMIARMGSREIEPAVFEAEVIPGSSRTHQEP